MRDFEAMREALRTGVRHVAVPQLFETPPDLAARMVELAGIEPGQVVLEPSAGTGRIVRAIEDVGRLGGGGLVCVEVNAELARGLADPQRYVLCRDFLTWDEPERLGSFDRVLMNPPFSKGADIDHVRHAFGMLEDGGKLVAIMGEGAFFRQDRKATAFRAWLDEVGGTSTRLPADTFKQSGTGVNTRLVTIRKGQA